MSTTKHTAEPWRHQNGRILSKAHGFVCEVATEDPTNADRIVTCVNGCAGIEDPGMALLQVRAFLRGTIDGESTTAGTMTPHGVAAMNLLRALGG